MRGYCFQRSFTHPYLYERLGDAWRMYDAPRGRGKARCEEFVSCHGSPELVSQVARKHAEGAYCLSAVHDANESGEEMSAEYRALGYRLGAAEPVMIHPLDRIPRAASPARVARVSTTAMVDRLAKAAGQRQILPEHLVDPPPQRSYVALRASPCGPSIADRCRSDGCGRCGRARAPASSPSVRWRGCPCHCRTRRRGRAAHPGVG